MCITKQSERFDLEVWHISSYGFMYLALFWKIPLEEVQINFSSYCVIQVSFGLEQATFLLEDFSAKMKILCPP